MAVLIVVLSIWRFISKMPQFSDMLPKAAPGMPSTVLPATDEEDCMNAESFYPAFVPRQFENTDITINEAVYGGVEQTRRKKLFKW